MAGSGITSRLVPHFEILKELGKGATSRVYLASRGGKEYALKFLVLTDSQSGLHFEKPGVDSPRSHPKDSDLPNSTHQQALDRTLESVLKGTIQAKGSKEWESGALRFRREAVLLGRISHPGIVRVHEYHETEIGLIYLVMEYVRGETLNDAIARGPFTENKFLPLAIQLTSALGALHSRGVLHRDIKPSNVVLNEEGIPKIIDFGFAIENDERLNPPAAGTLLYASPEACGVLRRPVTVRSDLYSLGALLFQCGAGVTPFESNPKVDLGQMHLSYPVPNIYEINRNIRPLIAQMLLKLMAKDPDDRYQSCDGLLWDLENLQAIESQIDTGKALLGSHDARVRSAELPLLGRSQELADLVGLWGQVRRKKGSIALIEGEGGIGKTRLTQELIHIARKEDALVLVGKAQSEDRTSYAPIRGAIDQFLESLMKIPNETEKNANLIRLRTIAEGVDQRLLVKVSPYFSHFLPESDQEQETGIFENEQELFHKALVQFLVALSRSYRSLLLVFEHGEFFDEATRTLIQELKAVLDGNPILLLITARNDSSTEKSFEGLVGALGTHLGLRIPLLPLKEGDCQEIIATFLGGKQLDLFTVGKLILASRGNPYSLLQYAKALLEGGVIYPAEKVWAVDSKRFEAVTLPNDVIDLIYLRLKKLDARGLEAVQFAAVIGTEFDATLVQQALGLDRVEWEEIYSDTIQFDIFENPLNGLPHFVHEGLRQRILDELSEERVQVINLTLARSLEKLGDDSIKGVVAKARYYVRAKSEDCLSEAYSSLFIAAHLCLESYSYLESYSFFRHAKEIGERINPASLRTVYEKLAEVCIFIGKPNEARASIHKAQFILENLKEGHKQHTQYSKAWLSYLAGACYIGELKSEQGAVEFWKALEQLGVRRPGSKVGMRIGGWLYTLRGFFSDWVWFKRGERAKQNIDQFRKMVLIAKICEPTSLGTSLFSTGQTDLLFWTSAYSYFATRKLRSHAGRVSSLQSMVIASGSRGNHFGVYYFSRQAEAMSRKLRRKDLIASCKYTALLALYWIGESKTVSNLLQETEAWIEKHSESRVRVSITPVISNFYAIHGLTKRCASYCQEKIQVARDHGNLGVEQGLVCRLFSQLVLLGRKKEALELLAIRKQLLGSLGTVLSSAYDDSNQVLADLDLEDFGPRLDEAISRLNVNPVAHLAGVQVGLTASGYVYLEKFRRANEEEQHLLLADVIRAVERSSLPLGSYQPAVFNCHRWILRGALATEQRKFLKARYCFWRANKDTVESGSLWGEWALAKERAWFERKRGRLGESRKEAVKALEISLSSGWLNRSEKIQREFNVDVNEAHFLNQQGASVQLANMSSSRSGASSLMSTQINLQHKRNFEALLRMSQISSQLMDPARQAQVALDELIQILGAERALLFLRKSENQERVYELAGLEVRVARGMDKASLSTQSTYSESVLARVLQTNQAVIYTGEERPEPFKRSQASAHAGGATGSGGRVEPVAHLQLRSVIAAPILIAERLIGVIYLDSRVMKNLFSEADLNLLSIVAINIAMGLETARAAKLQIDAAKLKLTNESLEHELVRKRDAETIAELDEKVKEKIREIHVILDHIRYGIFTFDSNGTIHSEYSKYLHVIFQRESLAGLPVLEAVFGQSNLTKDELSQVAAALETFWGEAVIQYRINQGLLPTEIIKQIPNRGSQILELEWVPILDEDDCVSKMMLTVRDVTEFRKASQEAKNHARELKMIGQLLNLDAERFRKLIRSSYSDLDAAMALLVGTLKESGPFLDEAKQVFRTLHTLKGNIRNYGLTEASTIIHETEEFYSNYLKSPTKWNWRAREQLWKLDAVRDSIQEYEILDRRKLSARSQKPAVQEIVLRDLLYPIQMRIPEMAQKLKKPVPEIQFFGTEVAVNTGVSLKIESIFGHLFSNAVAHGLPEKAKEEGVISIRSTCERAFTEITFEDSGRGLDLAALVKKTIQFDPGMATDLTDEEIAQCVFIPGVSTASTVSEIAGRGVGLDAVKSLVEDLGGEVRLVLTSSRDAHQFRKFKIVLRIPPALVFAARSSGGDGTGDGDSPDLAGSGRAA